MLFTARPAAAAGPLARQPRAAATLRPALAPTAPPSSAATALRVSRRQLLVLVRAKEPSATSGGDDLSNPAPTGGEIGADTESGNTTAERSSGPAQPAISGVSDEAPDLEAAENPRGRGAPDTPNPPAGREREAPQGGQASGESIQEGRQAAEQVRQEAEEQGPAQGTGFE